MGSSGGYSILMPLFLSAVETFCRLHQAVSGRVCWSSYDPSLKLRWPHHGTGKLPCSLPYMVNSYGFHSPATRSVPLPPRWYFGTRIKEQVFPNTGHCVQSTYSTLPMGLNTVGVAPHQTDHVPIVLTVGAEQHERGGSWPAFTVERVFAAQPERLIAHRASDFHVAPLYILC